MKSAEQMLREMRMLEVAQELRRVFGAKLVAIRDNQGNVHGRCELLVQPRTPRWRDAKMAMADGQAQ